MVQPLFGKLEGVGRGGLLFAAAVWQGASHRFWAVGIAWFQSPRKASKAETSSFTCLRNDTGNNVSSHRFLRGPHLVLYPVGEQRQDVTQNVPFCYLPTG